MEYILKNKNYDENGKIRSFDVNIKGANFIVYRLYNKFKPTNIFKFNEYVSFVEEKDGSIEIGWDTSAAGLQNLADQMGLELVNNTSSYSMNGGKPYFIEK